MFSKLAILLFVLCMYAHDVGAVNVLKNVVSEISKLALKMDHPTNIVKRQSSACQNDLAAFYQTNIQSCMSVLQESGSEALSPSQADTFCDHDCSKTLLELLKKMAVDCGDVIGGETVGRQYLVSLLDTLAD